jgi:hypothetical protein
LNSIRSSSRAHRNPKVVGSREAVHELHKAFKVGGVEIVGLLGTWDQTLIVWRQVVNEILQGCP